VFSKNHDPSTYEAAAKFDIWRKRVQNIVHKEKNKACQLQEYSLVVLLSPSLICMMCSNTPLRVINVIDENFIKVLASAPQSELMEIVNSY
jgi:hypothetical protein